MYDRATRALTQPATGTSTEVGPGSYNADVGGFDAKRKMDGYAPFCSMANRPSFLTVTKSQENNPGPGSFDPRFQDYPIGASALANRAQRFSDPTDGTPGPGSYNLSKASDWVKAKPLLPHAPGHGVLPQQTAYRLLAPPSIPSPGQSYGYEDTGEGVLRKQKSPVKDRTLGPAFYRVKDEETAPVKKYKVRNLSMINVLQTRPGAFYRVINKSRVLQDTLGSHSSFIEQFEETHLYSNSAGNFWKIWRRSQKLFMEAKIGKVWQINDRRRKQTKFSRPLHSS